MATIQPSAGAERCPVKTELIRKLIQAQSRLAQLYHLEVSAAVERDQTAVTAVVAERDTVQKNFAQLLIDYREHIRHHGC